MPELPEVETALRGVSPYLKGFTIEKIVVRQPQLRWVVSPELTTLKNVKILDTSRRAKYLIIHTEKGYIIGHLGMSGSVRIVSHDSPIDKHDQDVYKRQVLGPEAELVAEAMKQKVK